MSTAILVLILLVLGIARAEAGLITWHWSGPVTGHTFMGACQPGSDCGPSLESIVPIGTIVDVRVSFNFDFAAPPLNPSTPCLRGTASTSMQVLGRTFTNTGYVWDEAHGFGPGVCVPGYDVIEVVVPSWGSNGPALPDGWVAFSPNFLPGLWWAGDLMVQPSSIATQFPSFYKPREAFPQRFFADMQAVPATNPQPVPEPTTWLLVGTGLVAAWRRRRS